MCINNFWALHPLTSYSNYAENTHTAHLAIKPAGINWTRKAPCCQQHHSGICSLNINLLMQNGSRTALTNPCPFPSLISASVCNNNQKADPDRALQVFLGHWEGSKVCADGSNQEMCPVLMACTPNNCIAFFNDCKFLGVMFSPRHQEGHELLRITSLYPPV